MADTADPSGSSFRSGNQRRSRFAATTPFRLALFAGSSGVGEGRLELAQRFRIALFASKLDPGAKPLGRLWTARVARSASVRPSSTSAGSPGSPGSSEVNVPKRVRDASPLFGTPWRARSRRTGRRLVGGHHLFEHGQAPLRGGHGAEDARNRAGRANHFTMMVLSHVKRTSAPPPGPGLKAPAQVSGQEVDRDRSRCKTRPPGNRPRWEPWPYGAPGLPSVAFLETRDLVGIEPRPSLGVGIAKSHATLWLFTAASRDLIEDDVIGRELAERRRQPPVLQLRILIRVAGEHHLVRRARAELGLDRFVGPVGSVGTAFSTNPVMLCQVKVRWSLSVPKYSGAIAVRPSRNVSTGVSHSLSSATSRKTFFAPGPLSHSFQPTVVSSYFASRARKYRGCGRERVVALDT